MPSRSSMDYDRRSALMVASHEGNVVSGAPLHPARLLPACWGLAQRVARSRSVAACTVPLLRPRRPLCAGLSTPAPCAQAVVKYLLEAGAEPNDLDAFGITAMYVQCTFCMQPASPAYTCNSPGGSTRQHRCAARARRYEAVRMGNDDVLEVLKSFNAKWVLKFFNAKCVGGAVLFVPLSTAAA